MAELAEADVYFRIGVPFEDVWMESIAAANPRLRITDVRKGVSPRTLEGETAAHQHSHPGEEGYGGAARTDPHIWTDPRRVKIIAKNIQETLSTLDPAHRAEYEANYAEFTDELDRLNEDIRQLLADKKARRFMVFHPAWGYFAEAYGLRQIPIEVAGKEPGAQALARLIEEAKTQGIRVIFVQAQFSRRNAEAVARAIGGQVIAVDPLAENYVENLRYVAETFAEAMK
jgi:zinc transport system substrate-binding protein